MRTRILTTRIYSGGHFLYIKPGWLQVAFEMCPTKQKLAHKHLIYKSPKSGFIDEETYAPVSNRLVLHSTLNVLRGHPGLVTLYFLKVSLNVSILFS